MSNPGGIPIGTFPDGPGNDTPISDNTFINAASNPLTVSVDGQTFTEHTLLELIEADKYLKARSRPSNGWGSIGRARAVQPGGNGRDRCD